RIASFDATRPYALAQQLVRAVTGIDELTSAPEARAHLARFVDEIGMEDPARAKAAFEIILGIAERDASGDGGARSETAAAGEEFKRDILAAARNGCRAWASRAPGAVVVDDLHWSDPASLELVLQ